MDLNRETAMRLWGKAFGKETKVKDFAGREIAKGAYNDRNSEFGWNVDHILPQSKGGKTADYNLVCCHILTNDEKADKFPCFSANSIKFEIVKVENHYEIKRVDKKNKKQSESDDSVNFYDSASGIRFFKELKGKQNKPVFFAAAYNFDYNKIYSNRCRLSLLYFFLYKPLYPKLISFCTRVLHPRRTNLLYACIFQTEFFPILPYRFPTSPFHTDRYSPPL